MIQEPRVKWHLRRKESTLLPVIKNEKSQCITRKRTMKQQRWEAGFTRVSSDISVNRPYAFSSLLSLSSSEGVKERCTAACAIDWMALCDIARDRQMKLAQAKQEQVLLIAYNSRAPVELCAHKQRHPFAQVNEFHFASPFPLATLFSSLTQKERISVRTDHLPACPT